MSDRGSLIPRGYLSHVTMHHPERQYISLEWVTYKFKQVSKWFIQYANTQSIYDTDGELY